MKKILLFSLSCVLITLISALCLIGWTTHRESLGDTTAAYGRFQTADESGTHFNGWGLLAPLQVESQSIVKDTEQYELKVMYPCAEKFILIPPVDSTAEEGVAQELALEITEILMRPEINYGMDYDGTSAGVRKAANPTMRETTKPIVHVTLFGTASPEAVKYGFKNSVQPGSFEAENAALAEERVNRVAKKLDEYNFPVDSMSSAELQFPDTASANDAVIHPEKLNDMRYVLAKVTIIRERVVIQTEAAPWAIPIWLLFATLGLIGLWKLGKLVRSLLRGKKLDPEALKNFFRYMLNVIALIAMIVTAGVILYFVLDLVIAAMLILGVYACMFILYLIIRNFRVIMRRIGEVVMTVVRFLIWLWEAICTFFARKHAAFIICWKAFDKLPCWKKQFKILFTVCLVLLATVIILIILLVKK